MSMTLTYMSLRWVIMEPISINMQSINLIHLHIQNIYLDFRTGKLKQELRGGRYRTCIGQSQWNMKCRSRAPGQGACLKSISMTITMQGFTLAAINYAEKTKLRHKN